MAGVLGTHMLAQVGFIVKDVEETKKKWAAFLGVDVPETQPIGDFATTQTNFRASPRRKHTAGWHSLMSDQTFSWN